MDTTPNAPPPSRSIWNVPSWLTRLAAIGWRVLVTVAFAAIVIGFAAYLSTVTLSILFAVIAVATLAPIDERLRARGWGRAKAAGGTIAVTVVVVGGALLLIGLALIPFLAELTSFLHEGLERLSSELTTANLPADTVTTLDTVIQRVESWLSEQGSAIVDSLVEAGAIVMLGLFLTFYLLLDGDKAWDVGLAGLGGWQSDRIRDAGEEAMRRAGGYVRGTAAIAAVDAIVSFVVLTLDRRLVRGALGGARARCRVHPIHRRSFRGGDPGPRRPRDRRGPDRSPAPGACDHPEGHRETAAGSVPVRSDPRAAPRGDPPGPPRRLHDGRTGGHVRGRADSRLRDGDQRRRPRCARYVRPGPGVRARRHPRLARPPRTMELATSRRRRPHRSRGRHPVAVPGRRRPDRGRGHARRDVPAGRQDAGGARLVTRACLVRRQRRRVGDRDGRDVAVRVGSRRIRPGVDPGGRGPGRTSRMEPCPRVCPASSDG